MPLFKVWDPKNESLSPGTVEYEADTAEEAAEKYAEDDHDGVGEGYYVDGVELMTLDDHGCGLLITVTVEYQPTFYSNSLDLPEGYTMRVKPIEEGAEEYSWECGTCSSDGVFGSPEDAVKDARGHAAKDIE